MTAQALPADGSGVALGVSGPVCFSFWSTSPLRQDCAVFICLLKLFSFRTGGEVTPVVELDRRLIYKLSELGILAELNALMSGGEGHRNACL